MPKVLIVEDNSKLAQFIGQYLKKSGVDSDIAYDGVKALCAFAANDYDLLLIDVKLPKMDGIALSRKIRSGSRKSNIPIVMMSGFLKSPQEIDKLKSELFIKGYLTKPFSFDELYRLIRNSISGDQNLPEIKQGGTAAVKKPVTKKPKAEGGKERVVTGKLAASPFDKLLTLVTKNRRTGILTVESEKKKMKFFFMSGAPVDIEALSEEGSFGSYLIKKGLISIVELGEYEGRRGKEGGDPRDIFVKMGCLAPENFSVENRLYLMDSLVDAFSWRKGRFLFEPRPALLPAIYTTMVDLPRIFYKGFHDHLQPERLSAFLDENGKFFVAKKDHFFELQNHFTGEAVVDTVYGLINGARSVSDILNSIDSHEEEALSLIFTLNYMDMTSFSEKAVKCQVEAPFPLRERSLDTDAKQQEVVVSVIEEYEDLGEELTLLSDELAGIEDLKEPASGGGDDEELRKLEDDLKSELEKLKDKNYYQIFGLTQGTYSFNDLKKAYFDLTRKFGPDKFFASSGEFMGLAEEFLSKVSDAYNTLTNVVEKENYDEMISSQDEVSLGGDDDEMKLQIQFQSGKVFLQDKQYDSAEKAFTNCMNMAQGKPEFYAYLALAVYNNPANRASSATKGRVKDLVNKSLQLGKLSMAYALKGTLMLDDGNLSLAESEFNKALRINPNNKIAKRKMETLAEKRAKEKKGLFKRVFK